MAGQVLDVRNLLLRLEQDGTLARIARNPLAQFGTRVSPRLGAEVLPNREVPENRYLEDAIRYRSVIANAGTRYSPTQKKGGDLVGEFDVTLAESDIAREMNGQMYDALLRFLRNNASMEAMASVTNWLDTSINQALEDVLELWRWQAMTLASVTLQGDNGYLETVAYSNPTGHRVAAGGAWSSNAYDPYGDILAGVQKLSDKGYQVGRIYAGRSVINKLLLNANIRTRAGRISVNPSAQIVATTGRVTLSDLNGIFAEDGLPQVIEYNAQYRTQTGSGYFLDRATMVMVAATGRDTEVVLADTINPAIELLTDTLGYTAIGRAAGQPTPGRVIRSEFKADKPPRIEAEGWQTALPVITEPEAIFVINTIA